MMARHEMALQQLEADRSWVIFVDSGSLGIINQLMLTTAMWKKQRSKNECSCSLRQALMGAMLMELEARMVKLETDTSAQTPLVRARILLQDPLRWQHTKWSQEKKTHEPTGGAPLSHTTALTALRELKSLILEEGTIHTFHAMGGMNEREGGSHALQADPVDGGTSQGNHPRDPHPVHGIPATPGKEPSTAAKGTAATSPARAVKPTPGEPLSAPVVHGETRNSLTPGAPKSAPKLIQQGGNTATTLTPNPASGKPSVAPKARDKTLAPQAKGRPKSAPDTPGGCTAAPVQTIFSRGSTKTLETLPTGVLSEDLQRNDRHQGAKGKLHSGPNPMGTT